jgi:serine/threonine-protein kinase
MALATGTRLGPYAITAPIGAGGMGEVYRATDTNLGRQVAIKVLPDAFAQDPERLARFEREAKTLASLNHPNIAQIYGLEKADGIRALVLELVEGPTLADRIAQGPIPVDEALPIAKQIAEALEAAHEQGIIHRDLKPTNVKVRADGTVKVLDFGLAKALEPMTARVDATASPTITSPAMMTGVGVLLGTAAYMSPEQARGKTVDKRSDIWAFGCVLYEMLTGRRAFEDEDVSMTLSKVLQREPDFDVFPAEVPARVRQTTRLCLRKPVRERVPDIGAVRLALEGAFETTATQTAVAAVGHPPARWRRYLAPALASLVTAVVVALAAWNLWPSTEPPPRSLVRFEVNTPPDGPLTMTATMRDVAIAADGTRIVYQSSIANINSGRRLYVRHADRVDATLLRGTEGAQSPFFSPDGQWVGFAVTGTRSLKKVSVFGGPAVTIAELPDDIPRGVSWGGDDTIVFATAGSKGLRRVPAAGGKPEALTVVNPEQGGTDHWWPEILPSGKGVLFTVWSGSDESSRIAVVSLETREITYLVSGGSHPQYSRTGHIVYGVNGTLRAVSFDQDRLALTSTTPIPVLENVNTKAIAGGANFSLAANGSLVYIVGRGVAGPQRTLVWVDRDGREEPLRLPPANYNWAQVSPDGSRVAVSLTDLEGQQDVWSSELARGTLTRVTTEPGLDNDPVWTPDGERVVFPSRRNSDDKLAFYAKAADGTGPVELLLTSETTGFTFRPYDWSSDGKVLLFDYGTADAGGNIGMLSMEGGRPWKPLLQTPANEISPALSPDGAWLAYTSNQTGRPEVYMERFPNLGDRRQLSTDGGSAPLWSPNGRELFYRRGDAMMVVGIDPRTLSVGSPEALFEGPYEGDAAGSRRYDMSPDGRRFLMIKQPPETAEPPDIIVVENWDQELKRLVPTN